MPILRSRQIPSLPSNSKTLEKGFIEPPSTPSKTTEISGIRISSSPNSAEIDPNFTSVRRRSSRLASKMNSDQRFRDSCNSRCSRRRLNEEAVESNCDSKVVGDEESNELGFKLGQESSVRVSDCDVMMTSDDLRNDEGRDKGKGVLIKVEDDDDDDDEREMGRQLSLGLQGPRRKFTREEKGKGVKLIDDVVSDDVKLNLDLELSLGLKFFGDDEVNDEFGLPNVVNDDFELPNVVNDDFELPNVVNDDFGMHDVVIDDDVDDYVNEEGGFEDEADADPAEMMEAQWQRAKKHRDRFKDIARRSAARLANYIAPEEPLNAVAEEMPQEQPVGDLDDWPGPFSTALKIISDREQKLNWKQQESSSEKRGFPLDYWTPRTDTDRKTWKKVPRSLQDYCLDVLSKNADALTSLCGIPEGMRNKLTRLLCDNRRMTPHVFGLLLKGSPVELRIADCSWMEERVFEQSFQACDTSNLKVLQLDLCGHCVSDFSLRKALVSKELPALTTISLKGACRISDNGLASLVSSAPALTSLNLSQCSLLTDVGIDSIANSLGSTLQELYLDYCDGLNTKRMLPMLQRMKSLEVLSLRGLVGVSDNFVSGLVNSNGENMKGLVLADCVNLTDSSLKVIGDKCSQLRVLDLSNLGKLTDLGLLFITNGCRKIQNLNLRRCSFSDNALSAFLEVSGESVVELSLNNIRKVGQNTTLSLAKHCKNLESLDLSWCRCLTDEALGLIADSCLSLKLLKLFGCTQVSEVFVKGHSNPHLQIVGLKLTPILEHIKRPEFQ